MLRVNHPTREWSGGISRGHAQRIHELSLEVLANVGLRVHNAEAQALFRRLGATIDEGKDTIRVPQEIVEWALEECPRQLRQYTLSGQCNPLGRGVMALGTGTHRLSYLEYGARTPRPATVQDLKRLVRLADALPGIDVVSPMVAVADGPAGDRELLMLETLVLNTGKHLWNAPMTAEEARWTLDLAEILSDKALAEQPTVTIRACTKSPLVLADEVADIIIASARRGAILSVGSASAAGSTSPVTLAGTVLLQNAEFLSQMTLAQIARPGTIVDYAVASTTTDLRTGMFNLGAVEYALITAGSMAMAQHYGLSLSTSYDTESPVIDVHNGMQKMLGIAYKMAMGVSFLRNVGSLNNGLSMSCEQMVIDHEIAQMLQRFWCGIRVDADALAMDVISDVGPGGEYLAHEHTLKYCRSGEHYLSSLPPYASRRDGLTLPEWAHQRVEEILSTHEYKPTSEREKRVLQYVAEGGHELRKAGR